MTWTPAGSAANTRPRHVTLFHAAAAAVLALTALKIGLAHIVIPRSQAVVALEVTLAGFTVLWAVASTLRNLLPGPWSAAVLASLAVEAILLLPMLRGQNHTLSLFYAACLGQSFAALFYGAFGETRPVRFALPALSLAQAVFVARKTPQAPALLTYLLFLVPLLLFGVAALLRTVAEQRRKTVELYDKQRELNQTLAVAGRRILEQQKQATLAQITAGVAHEINNPVNFLAGNLPFLEGHFRDLLARAQQAAASPAELRALEGTRADVEAILKRYREGVTRITETVAALRRMFSTSSSATDTHDLAAILRSSTDHAGLSRKKGIEHWLDLPEPLPFRCTPADFHTVFSNLLTNALDAVADQGVVYVTGRKTERGISIAFEDTGRGVPSEDLARVFEPFFTTKPGGANLGIGLTLCKNIVESYGGAIEIESEEGRRTRVSVLLPPESRQP